MNPILGCESLTVSRGGREVLRSVSLSFEPGITAILGPNGAGKTSFFEGLLDPKSFDMNAVRFRSKLIRSAARREFYAHVGYLPQSWEHQPGFNVRESVEYAAWLKGVPATEVRRATESILSRTDLSHYASFKVRTLSGGTKQRVGLAEAFVHNPSVVLLDEPTVGLDPSQRSTFRRFLIENSKNKAIILSTHLTDDVEAVADRVAIIHQGEVVFNGSVAELSGYADPLRGATSRVESGYLAVVETHARR